MGPSVDSQVHDINFNFKDSCNSRCCLPKTPKVHREKIDEKVKNVRCIII